MESVKIVLLTVALAVGYGVLHDQVTARMCVEYFTIGHPPVFPTTSPTWLAIGWGIIATWWAGAIIGVPLAVAARAGRRPKYSAGQLFKPGLYLLVGMGAAALVAGAVGYGLARGGSVWLLEPLASWIPKEQHALFLADWWAHMASYASGFLGGIILCLWVWRTRRRA